MASPLAGFHWLARAINIGGRNPKGLLLAAALVGGVALLPSLVTLPLQLAYPNDLTMFTVAMGIALVAGLILSPVFAGFLQVIDAIECGRPVRARDVFAPYHTGLWKPIIGLTLCMWVLYALAFVLIVAAMGEQMRALWVQAFTVPQAQRVPVLTLPPGFWRMVAITFVSSVFISSVWALATGQVALGRQRVIAAFQDGLAGTLKNLPALLSLTIGGMLLAFAFGLLFLLVASIIGLLGKFAGDPIALALMVPVDFAALVAIYVVTFGVTYQFWRDVCADAARDATPTAVTEA